MTIFKSDPSIITDEPITIEPLRPRRSQDIEILYIDVVLGDDGQLQLRLSGTTNVIQSSYSFSTGCAQTFAARFTFRGGRGSVTVAATAQSYYDEDRDGIIELALASPGEHTLEISCKPTATAEQQSTIGPRVPTTKVILRPDTNCPQPKTM
ncbi:MAG TPA: hypothetical protein VK034_03365 [Enhygromyxa sp.]|nr:hypothetical protein [Enhygromyxa sp.]